MQRWLFALLLFPALQAQTGSVVTGAGYASPKPLAVAPGQVITLFVRTSQITLNAAVSADPKQPLPTSLAGFTVGLKQTFADQEQPVPLLSAAPVVNCTAVNPVVCSSFTALTVQIPFELQPNAADSRLPANFAALVVYENGVAGDPLALDPVYDRIHVVTSCDTTDVNVNPPCVPLVLHADGSTVTLQNPAKSDELLTVKLYGLGRPDTAIASGSRPSSAIGVAGMKMYVTFGNALAPGLSGDDLPVLSANLTSDAVGLYTLTFRAPKLPEGTPDCAAQGLSNAVNVNISISRGISFDGAGICVQ